MKNMYVVSIMDRTGTAVRTCKNLGVYEDMVHASAAILDLVFSDYMEETIEGTEIKDEFTISYITSERVFTIEEFLINTPLT